MQSVASLMSIGKTDIGNLEDVEDDEESDLNMSAKVAEITSQMNQLPASSQNMGNPFGDPDLDVDDDDDYGIFFLLFAYFTWVSPHTVEFSPRFIKA